MHTTCEAIVGAWRKLSNDVTITAIRCN